MKKYLALLMAMLLCFTFVHAEEADQPCTWQVEEGRLAVYVRTTASGSLAWTASVSEEGMLTLVSEEYEADVISLDSTDEVGRWVTTWQPEADAAGIVEISLVCRSASYDMPDWSCVLEIYLDGQGGITVLTVNGQEVGELPVD